MSHKKRHKSEGELYKRVMRVFRDPEKRASIQDELKKKVQDLTEGAMVYFSRTGDRTVYVVGGTFYSKEPVQHIHREIAPAIVKAPRDWAIFRQGASLHLDFPETDPAHFYCQELARMFRLPYEDALADITSKNTRNYIQEVGGISPKDLDRWVITRYITTIVENARGAASTEGEKRIVMARAMVRVAEILGKPLAYVADRILEGPTPDKSIEDTILLHWGNVSREMVYKEIGRIERRNILISIEYEHVAAFIPGPKK